MMYDLKRSSEVKWAIVNRDTKQVFEGSLKEVCQVAVGLGFDMVEIEDAVNEMAWMEHDAAHFGVFKGFIFTYDTKEKAI